MNQNLPKDSASRDPAEPGATYDPVPVWLIMAFGALVYWALVYFSDHGAGFNQQVYAPFESLDEVAAANPKSAADEMYLMGKDVFDKTCSACHQPTGQGKDGVAPPLVGSEWVLAPGPNRIVRIVLNGFTGPVTVKGKEYNNLTMVPWKDTYDDKHIAAVLTFVRSSWGNKGTPVKPEDVAAARKEIHPGPETVPELEQIPVQ